MLYLLGFDLLTGVFVLTPLALIDKRPGVMRSQQFHRLVPIAGNRKIRHALDPSSAHTGDRIQRF